MDNLESLKGPVRTAALLALLLAGPSSAFATTTVTVDDKPQTVVVTGVPVVSVQPVATQQVVVTQVAVPEDFEGEIEKIDRATRTIDVIDTEQKTRQVIVTQEAIDTYRTGDFVRIHSIPNVREVTFVREESNRDLEGRIINVDNSQATLTVRDGQGRDRRVKLKQGMIGNYKVDDYVRIHLMADLKEAKMIRTIK